MPFCSHCGADNPNEARYCHNCGRPLVSPETAHSPSSVASPQSVSRIERSGLRTVISPTRVIFMTVLSYGLYFFYWFFVTWKHYRDYSKEEAYPVWHTLTLLVPVYGLFRTHAHVRTYKELAASHGVLSTLAPGWVVLGVAVSGALDWASFRSSLWGQSQGGAVLMVLVDALSMAISAVVVLHVQGNLNRFWRSLQEVQAMPAAVGVGEVVTGIIGALAWVGTIMSLAGLA
ncbi:MAG: zinc ribbon domain-containing protein [Chloroflexi bacterium]|nr:zinc ribbon domain-containing protein [Chloroflexota bacterium]